MTDSIRQQGDILEAKKRDKTAGRHFIVYYEGYSEENFIGGMITHLEDKRNIPMNKSHFELYDKNDNKYKITFDNTNLVVAKLIKFESWGPFTKVGRLSQKGIEFVTENIGELNSETFEEYKHRTK